MPRRGFIVCGILLFLLSLGLRLIRFDQSLWCDEMSALLDYMSAPWKLIVAAGPGQYVPNDHVLYTIIAKAMLLIGNGGRIDNADAAARWIRLPALLCGALIPVAAAWPLRRSAPRRAAMLGLLLAVHPWMIAQSDEARGYSLMVLLGVVATNLLPTRQNRWPLLYAGVLAAAMYSVMVAALLLPAHGAYVLLRRRDAISNWLRGAALAVALGVILYLPLAAGILDYYRHPLVEPDSYVAFLNVLPRFAFAGYDLSTNPLGDSSPIALRWLCWSIPMVVLTAGSLIGRRAGVAAPFLFIMAGATLSAVLIAFFDPAIAQVRFVPWAGLWFCAAFCCCVEWLGRHLGCWLSGAVLVGAVGLMVWIDFQMPPDQPIREAIAIADHQAPRDHQLVVAFLTADQAGMLYRDRAQDHPLIVAPSPRAFFAAERRARKDTTHLPWIIISYESIVRDAAPGSWAEVTRQYRLVERLAGRVSGVAIYAPRE